MDRRFVQYHRSRDRGLRDALVAEHLPFAHALARRYAGGREPRDDLEQVAALGLIKALDRFDPDRGVPFTAFAYPTVLGELRRHFRDACSTIRVPRPLRDRHRLISTTVANLAQELGRPPVAAEVATQTCLTVDEVLEAMDAGRAVWSVAGTDDLEDHLTDGSHDRAFAAAEARAVIRRLAHDLTARDRRLLYLRFVEGRSQREIAAQLGMSQMHVSRLLKGLLQTMGDRVAS